VGVTYRANAKDTRWDAVALGWLAAVLVGALLVPALDLLYGSLVGTPVGRGGPTAAAVVVSVVAGFLACLAGGFLAGRLAGFAGGRHGALIAFLGLVAGAALGLALTVFGISVFAWGVATPPAVFGLAGGPPALGAGFALFLADLFGGYVGGKLGEPAV